MTEGVERFRSGGDEWEYSFDLLQKGRLSFTNNLNIDYSKADREPVAFSEFAKANPYFRKYDKTGVKRCYSLILQLLLQSVV